MLRCDALFVDKEQVLKFMRFYLLPTILGYVEKVALFFIANYYASCESVLFFITRQFA